MTEITEEGKQYRVMCWLDSISACSSRLASIRAELESMGADRDGVKAVRYDLPKVSGGEEKTDQIGNLLAACEESAARLTAEAAPLEEATRNAERAIREAWEADGGANDSAFQYVIDRYVRNVPHAAAARAAGMGRFEAKLSARKVAASIYDTCPELFRKPVNDRAGYFGYWETMADIT